MNSEGEIRRLEPDEEPKSDETLLSEMEAEILQKVPKAKRNDKLRIMRALEKRERRQARNLREVEKQGHR